MSQHLFTWQMLPIFMSSVNPKVGSSQPLVWGSNTELNLHFNLHLNQQLAAKLPGPDVFLYNIKLSLGRGEGGGWKTISKERLF